MQWKIYYSDSTYSDDEGPPELAPKRDVQAVVVKSELVGRRVERGSDFYVWAPGRGGWRGVDQFGLYDYLIDPGHKVVLFGRVLSNPEYRAVFERAANDPDFPENSAIHPDERAP